MKREFFGGVDGGLLISDALPALCVISRIFKEAGMFLFHLRSPGRAAAPLAFTEQEAVPTWQLRNSRWCDCVLM